MAVNQSGIAISIKAFLPTGKTLDEAFNALSLVKAAHESGNYTALLAAAQIDEIKTEQKTRRIENHGVTVADLATKADPLAVEPEQAPFVPTECDDAPVGLAVVEDSTPLPWADNPPADPDFADLPDAAPTEEAKPKGKKKTDA